LKPDLRTARWLAKVGMSSLGDDGLLSAVVRSLEEEGFGVIGVDEILKHLLAETKVYGRLEPDAEAVADIERGIAVAKVLGAADVGQGVVVQQGIVLAVEAAEGTDALLRRAGELRRAGPGGVLVKIKKPGQEHRADLPTIGQRTVEVAAAAGLRGIAVEAGGALVIGGDALGPVADSAGLFVVGIQTDS
ncbi:MAG: UDP-2,3-diacylglucosamine diphosphatase LpxI, partial [Rhodospirillales bacterium]|nr:UDP-2,3-diacylglucosamine diphosphatase LpxI [Rhodospirillales bacterium]